jgi:phosphoribosyl 1,2-cyclic phosphodiesterase
MKVKFWGVRGSVPIPGPATARYGGNTPCVEISTGNGECIILDAGTGLRALGVDLISRGGELPPINLFITHTHWDHIQGFPFFAPCYMPRAAINVRGPVHFREGRTLQHVFDLQMQYEFFPVSNDQLAADIGYETLAETTLLLGAVNIASQFMNHSIQSLGYRLTEQGATVVYTGDHEPYYDVFTDDAPAGGEKDDDLLFGDVAAIVQGATDRFLEFIRGADLLIVDCQYTPLEYPSKKRTWGHSSWDFCLDWMHRANIRQMALTHHDPLRTDEALDRILGEVRQAAAARGIAPESIMMAYEGMEITL